MQYTYLNIVSSLDVPFQILGTGTYIEGLESTNKNGLNFYVAIDSDIEKINNTGKIVLVGYYSDTPNIAVEITNPKYPREDFTNVWPLENDMQDFLSSLKISVLDKPIKVSFEFYNVNTPI